MIAEAILYIYIYYFRYIDIWVHVVIYNVISYGFHFHIFQWDDPWPSSHQGLSRGCSDIAVEAAPSAAPCVAMSNEAQMREPYWILTCPIPKPNLRPLWRIFLAAADDVESKMHGSCWWSCGKIRVPVTSYCILSFRTCVCVSLRVCVDGTPPDTSRGSAERCRCWSYWQHHKCHSLCKCCKCCKCRKCRKWNWWPSAPARDSSPQGRSMCTWKAFHLA